jgi:hypothetical protein
VFRASEFTIECDAVEQVDHQQPFFTELFFAAKNVILLSQRQLGARHGHQELNNKKIAFP